MNLTAVYVLWLREMKKFIRAKSRIVGTFIMPLLFLGFLGLGFNKMSIPGLSGVGYLQFLVPGIVGMSMLFTSMFSGMSVLWDREFGFLKEIMVAPVDRVSIVIGRILGGATGSLITASIILAISMLMGFVIRNIFSLAYAFVFMLLISTTFIGLGLIFASKMSDMQGFSLVMNFVIMPLFFLSGALFPIQNLPAWIAFASYLDPLTYGVDGLRGVLIGVSSFSVAADFFVLLGFSAIMVILGAHFFEKSESV
ncbi:MAG: ABC transporter permease [Candidatus Heimdallarchaeota archaeon]